MLAQAVVAQYLLRGRFILLHREAVAPVRRCLAEPVVDVGH